MAKTTLTISSKNYSSWSMRPWLALKANQIAFEEILIPLYTGDTDKKRSAWLNQFTFTFGNDEGEEGSSFQGTIPQALMMMNGELMDRATGGKPGSFLADLRDAALLQRKARPDLLMVNNLYLAALSRGPSNREGAAARHLLESQPDTICVLEDIFWALLNSNEFVLNH